MILFFDTETTGLPRNWKAPVSDLENWPRIIQMAWIVADKAGEVIIREKYLIKPDGWVVPNEKFWIDNGYSTELCELGGVPLQQVMENFLFAMGGCEIVVAHNMDYDIMVTGAEMLRYGFKAAKKRKICTKEAGTEVCKLPGKYGNYKWPSLTELHQFLFKKDFEGAHDALFDVEACMACFFEMVKRSIIQL